MKRILIILGVSLVLMVPAAFAVAAAPDSAPVAEQNSIGIGAGDNYGEPQTVRVQEAVQTQNGARFGEGPMDSADSPYRFGGFGPDECTGNCEGPYGPNFGAETPFGPMADDGGSSYGPGPHNGAGPVQEGPLDGDGNQYGPGQGGHTSASPGGSTNQNGTGPGGGK